MSARVVTSDQFEIMRLLVVAIVAGARLLAFKPSIQEYLNTAEQRVLDIQRKTMKTRIYASAMQNEILNITKFCMCAAMHIIAPAALLLSMAILQRIK